MKYHWSVKLITILLAAVLLTGAIASGISAVCLLSEDLYERTVEEVYSEQLEYRCHDFALNLAHRYASLELGKIPEDYLEQYFGTHWMYYEFREGSWFYTITDAAGNILKSTLPQNLEGVEWEMDILLTDIRYRQLISDPRIPADRQETEPNPSVPNSTEATEPSVPNTTEATEEVVGEAFTHRESYWDTDLGAQVEIAFRFATLEKCTVTLYLMENALGESAYWTVLQELHPYRYTFFWVLGIGLALFAAVAVYLFCAAGKKPGCEEIRAGGLNRIPLDLYLTGGIALVAALIVLGVEGFDYLIRYAYKFSFVYALTLIFMGSLLLIGFCLAVFSQLKMKNGFWLRNCLLGRIWLWCWGKLKVGFRFLWKSVKKFFSLMPLMWQWMAAMGAILVWVIFAFLFALWANHGFFRMLWLLSMFAGILSGIALVVYAAYCYGVLMDSAKKLAQGDLHHKVSVKYLFGCFRDFADRLNSLGEAVQAAAREQMKSERMKSELITNVSHDIKTPLTSIINFVDLLEKPHTEQQGKEYLEVLSRQSQRMKKLIEDLMEMSKASSGTITAELGDLDAIEAVNQALGEFSDKFHAANLTPIFRHPDTPVMVRADGRLVWRILSNILGNTVKYALPGTRVYLDLLTVDGSAVLSIKNISREELNVDAAELMERFVRGDASRNTEGSGLGLNIARSLADLQQGQMDVTVDGDLFKVTLTFPVL